jgi:toxin-antitoxin system PIN domain toxin
VIAVDTNILVYAHRMDSPWHDVAFKKVKELADQNSRWAIPYPCIHEFYSVVTHPKIYSPPSTQDQAIHFLNELIHSPHLTLLSEDESYWPEIQKTLRSSKAVGGMIHDARIASLCLIHGVRELWTFDRDFTRFPRLKIKNPLI